MFPLVHPFTWGLWLVGVPVLIHLINMLRHQRVEWAAMEFLLQSQKKHRTWVILKQLLLLLLRMAAIALVVLALAQPLLPDRWGSFLGASPRIISWSWTTVTRCRRTWARRRPSTRPRRRFPAWANRWSARASRRPSRSCGSRAWAAVMASPGPISRRRRSMPTLPSAWPRPWNRSTSRRPPPSRCRPSRPFSSCWVRMRAIAASSISSPTFAPASGTSRMT